LLSSVWGSLSRWNKIHTDNIDGDYSDIHDNNDTQYKIIEAKWDCVKMTFDVVDTNNPYSTPYARLKPFMTSYARNFVGTTIMNNNVLKNVIRIHTDGIILSEKHKFNGKYVPTLEDKTTGQIIFKSLNDYNFDLEYYKDSTEYEIIDCKQSTFREEI
jgi:hypothetical protein